MSKLSLLQKNAYINILIKDNGIWVHLAYTDFNASREYILSDYTDLNALKFLLDDNVFSKEFWYQYFNNLEKTFNWDIIDKDKSSIFTFRPFTKEGDGVSGVRVQIDDNQKFFDKILASVREFSNDVALRVIDDNYMFSVLDGISSRINADDLMYIDMDLYDFSIFRITTDYEKGKPTGKKIYTKSKMSWKDQIQLIDSIKDNRFEAFLSTDLTEKALINIWANFVIDKPLTVKDQNLLDILRSYSTIQNFSIYRDNKKKITGFGKEYTNSAMIIAGGIARILGKSKVLMTIIDGFELIGNFDCYFDNDLRILAYGKSYSSGVDSTDIILTKKSILSPITKVVIPYTKSKTSNKILFSGTIESVNIQKSDFYILSPQYTFVKIPTHQEKLLIEGKFRNGAKTFPLGETDLSYVSSPEINELESILFDCRTRPVVYGPDAYSNKIKLQSWINDNQA